MSRPSLPYQPDYAEHPAFAPHLRWNSGFDRAVDEAVDILDRLLLDLESTLTMKRRTLAQALEQMQEPLRLTVNLLLLANQGAGAGFQPFAGRFQRELLRVMVDDLAYFERRNSYEPVINDAAELARRNDLAVKGFIRFALTPEELAALRRQVSGYLSELDDRYRRGARSRDDLSVNEIDPETRTLVNELFARRGMNKAVSDVRHERAQASGMAIELSPDDTDWWHSRYTDAGLAAPNQTAYFHNDESRDAYKAIICLDDVTEDGGPFGFLPASYDLPRPRFEWVVARALLTTLAAPEIRQQMSDMHPRRGPFSSRVAWQLYGMLPPRLRVSSHFGYDVLDNSPLAARLLSEEVKMVGPAGQVIVFDGSRVVHRGGLVRRGRRAALQVVFEVDKRNGTELHRRLDAR